MVNPAAKMLTRKKLKNPQNPERQQLWRIVNGCEIDDKSSCLTAGLLSFKGFPYGVILRTQSTNFQHDTLLKRAELFRIN
jgi:hypothetical protein